MPVPKNYTQIYDNYDKAFITKIHSSVINRSQDASGNDVTRPVLTVFATPERAFAQVQKQLARVRKIDEEQSKTITIPLPIISVSRGAPLFDPTRYNNASYPRMLQNAAGETLGMRAPKPYNIPYTVDIWTRTLEEQVAISNQFLQWLDFDYFYLHVAHPAPLGERIVYTRFVGAADSSQLATGSEKQRSLRYTMSFHVNGWLTDDVAVAGSVIQTAIVDLYAYTWDPPPVEHIVVGVDSLAAAASETPPAIERQQPMIAVPMHVAMIVGEAVADTQYGALTLTTACEITGMQASVGGEQPTGSSLVFVLVVNGVAQTDHTLTINANAVKAASIFGTPFAANAGDVIAVKCASVGSGTPGDWVSVQIDTSIPIVT